MTSKKDSPIQRIEPPFWYAGMCNKELQILFYGENIAKNFVETTEQGIIIKVTKTDNANFIFVTINVNWEIEKEILFIFKRNNKILFSQKYSIKQRRKNSADRKGFDSSDVVYLIMPDRFANGNGLNDNDKTVTEKYNRELPGGRHGGDINGITQHLDYIQSLGVTALWNTPVCEDNEAEFSYHTYAQSDVYKVDPRFGTNEDYVRLSEGLHQRGMKLIHDYVTNHWGLQHWMVKDPPTKDWINTFETYVQTNHKRTTVIDVNASKIDRQQCIEGWFVPSMPDLNITNPLVLKYLTQNAIWWIEYANLDGLRIDTFNYAEPLQMVKWTKAIMTEYPNFNMVGEITQRNHGILSYWQKDSKTGEIYNFNSNLPSLMDFSLCDALQLAFNDDDGMWDKGMTRIYDSLTFDFLYPNVHNLLIFAENHDSKRLNHCYELDLQKYKLAMVVLATVRGIPQLYYGSEVGMAGDQYFMGDADIRQDFPGGWVGDASNAFYAEGRTEDQKAYFEFTSQLFQWRKTKAAIHFGKTTHYIPEDNIYVYFRYNNEDSIMVIINNKTEMGTVRTIRFKENIEKFTTGLSVFTNEEIELINDISIEGKSFLILELR
ncbi:glycoside hydrolase family 13 protein [Flavobacterium algicola]|uniref:glycoside hydrolase family 13 protein n=1 Tax=Flavobacterium algicola TaxID=556529 RepID=UPI001EFE1363|nr:glycoside hydrolase family 13 protein [Flavobacterium algicola]MCG9794094.1 glycoside hydrolase family 13 protein [Flavobacterium algicola]